MFSIPFVKKNIQINKNRIANSIREHVTTLQLPNPWPNQSHVISSLAAGAEDAWQDQEVFEQINPLIVEFLKESIGMNVKVQCHMWYNVYNEGFMQEAHSHHTVGALASGIVYVQMPKGASGTTFLSPMRHLFNSCDYKQEYTLVTPAIQEGDCIIFPPWLEHRVDKQNIENTRITVAFNVHASK